MPISKGFTVIELIITMGIIAILSSLATVNLVTIQRHTSVSATILTLQADLKQQQLKAMDGDTQVIGSASSNYGIRFETNKYTLFRNSFIDGTVDNFAVNLDGNLAFTTLGDITFSKGNGQLTGLNTITLQDDFNNHQTLNINYLGVVESLN
jgi:prepilin-type N-terminal cleavage/methylation domain-containing protein